jgi:ligand-binding sensor domain-containing protein
MLFYLITFSVCGQKEFSQYKISQWTTDDGLPSNSLVSLCRDENNYLWIGSWDGLIRFDGAQFITYNTNKVPQLTSHLTRVIVADHVGNAWIGTGSGLLRHHKGTFTNLAGDQYNFFIESLWLDEANHKIWIGARNAGIYTYDIRSNKYEKVESLFFKDLINSIVPDNQSNLWIGSEKSGAARYHNGTWSYYAQEQGLASKEVICIHSDASGLYVGTTSGLFVFENGKFVLHDRFNEIRINRMKRDREGNLWVATVTGIHIQNKDGAWKQITKADGLSNNDIRDIEFDSEGSIWLATYRGGLNQLRKTSFVTYSTNEGLLGEAIGAVGQLSSNQFLVGNTEGKLYTIENGIVNPFQIKTKIEQRIYGILKDDKRNLWITSYDGLLLITPGGQEFLFTEKEGLPTRQIRSIFQDSRKNYWIGSRTAGLIKMEYVDGSLHPTFEKYRFDQLTHLNSTFIMSIEEDNDGNLLVASNTGGLNVLSPEGDIKNYNKEHGLISNITYSARADKDNIIWIATSDGLCKMENGKIFTYSQREGLPHQSPFDCIVDSIGYCWLPTAKGIIRVSKQELLDYEKGKIKTINWKLFDKRDELRNSEGNGATKAFIAANGKLFFLMFNGVVTVDPGSISLNKRAIDAFIESIQVDEKLVDLEKEIELPAGSHRVSFRYIAPDLQYPKTVRYRYRLSNFDNDWVYAGYDQEAIYTSLPNGKYSFTVAAANNDGVWNSQGATITFIVQPHYYQTWWFYILLTTTALSGIYFYTQFRVRSMRGQAILLENKVDERTKEVAQQRDELITLNEELQSSREEILAQRDSLSDKNREIERINSNLERTIADRTHLLEMQNKQLSEYAFINAHKLRAPLASILGLLYLFTKAEAGTDEHALLLEHLNKAARDLDEVIRSINRMLERVQ